MKLHARGTNSTPIARMRTPVGGCHRVEYFEPPLQRLFSFTRTEAFRDRAASLGGYDITSTATVVFNARR